MIDIEKEFEKFFEFPTEDKNAVTSTSAKLFARNCVHKSCEELVLKYESEIEDKNALIKDLYEKANDRRPF